MVQSSSQYGERETRWQRIKAPHSCNPRDGLTRVRPFWRLDVHLLAAYWRIRYWWWGKRGF